MQLTESQQRYGLISQLFHWVLAGLFVIQYYLIYRRSYFPKDAPEKIQYMLLHKSLGVTILVLGLLFIVWRLWGNNTKPPLPETLSTQLKFVARSVHLLLYGFFLAMPITGYVMSVASNHQVAWFGVPLPSLLAPNTTLDGFFYQSHVYLSYCIIGIVALHTLAALQHHFILKDNVLRRMLPF